MLLSTPPPLPPPLISPDADGGDGIGDGSPNQITREILKEKDAARTANDTSLPPPCIGKEGGQNASLNGRFRMESTQIDRWTKRMASSLAR